MYSQSAAAGTGAIIANAISWPGIRRYEFRGTHQRAPIGLLTLEDRLDPHFRDAFDILSQRALVDVTQWLARLTRKNPESRLCQKFAIEGEKELAQAITETMGEFLLRHYRGRIAERAGNPKAYGIMQADFEVLDNLPGHLRMLRR